MHDITVLPVIIYKYKTRSTGTPTYLPNLIDDYLPARILRSSDKLLVSVLRLALVLLAQDRRRRLYGGDRHPRPKACGATPERRLISDRFFATVEWGNLCISVPFYASKLYSKKYKCVIMQVTDVLSFSFQTHQKSFGDRARWGSLQRFLRPPSWIWGGKMERRKEKG